MWINWALGLLVVATLAVGAQAGDLDEDLMQREIIRLNAEVARLKKQVKESEHAARAARAAAPDIEVDDAAGDKPAKPVQRKAAKPRPAKPKPPKTRDCPNRACKNGVIHTWWWRAVPVRVGWAWSMVTFYGKGPVGICPVCGGRGRVEASLAHQ